MATYTMPLSDIIDHYSQDSEILSVREKIEIGRGKLFDFYYPIFDESYRNVFETNFIRNFYMREIGFEVEGLFKFQLESWLLLNMPYFNKLFESELLKFNPLESYNLKTTYQRKNDTLQNDDKLRNQKDSKTSNQLENQSQSINETELKTQNDSSIKNQNDSKLTNQTSETNKLENGLTKTTENIVGNENSTGSSVTDSENNSETDTTNTQSVDGLETNQDFNRKLSSDNPDSRLALSTQEGEGVIQYATSIEENLQKNNKTIKNDVTGNNNDVTLSTSETNTISESDLLSESERDLETTVKNDGNESSTSNINDSLTSTIEDRFNGQSNNNRNNQLTGSVNRNEKDDLESNVTDKNVTKINNLEDYIEEKIGSIGVKTYSEMVMEYRNSLIRIEKEIFKEMNQLFMLVY